MPSSHPPGFECFKNAQKNACRSFNIDVNWKKKKFSWPCCVFCERSIPFKKIGSHEKNALVFSICVSLAPLNCMRFPAVDKTQPKTQNGSVNSALSFLFSLTLSYPNTKYSESISWFYYIFLFIVSVSWWKRRLTFILVSFVLSKILQEVFRHG